LYRAKQKAPAARHTLPKKEFTAFVNTATLTLFRSTYLDNMKMLPPEKRAKIIAALKANPNASAVARQVGGVCGVTVWRIAKQTGINVAAAEAARRAKIIAALKANPCARSVARQVGGVSYGTVWRIAKQTGIKLAAGKEARALSPKTLAKIIAALKANPNAKAVTRQVGGVCHSTVWRIAKQTDIELSAGKAAKGRYRAKQKAPAARHAQKS
jgi:hypothetical protein